MNVSDVVFLGDVHGQVNHVIDAMTQAAQQGIGTIIQVGDFWCYKEDDIALLTQHQEFLSGLYGVTVTIHFIDGNHEDFTILNPHGPIQEFGDNLMYYHPRGDVFELHGVTVGSFGGAVSVNQSRQVPGVNWFSDEFPSAGDVERARQSFSQGLDVLVTHEIPEQALNQVLSPGLNTTIYNAHKVREIVDELVTIARPSLVVHGHWHVPAIGRYGDHTVISLGKNGLLGSTVMIIDDQVCSLHQGDVTTSLVR